MTSSNKIMTGILAFLPLLLFAVYLVSMLTFFIRFFQNIHLHEDPEEFLLSNPGNLLVIVLTAILLGLLSLGTMVYFIVHAINNSSINRDERIVWILVFIFAGMVTYPVYWYMRIWKQQRSSGTG